jgi:hypothetical protein
MVKHVEEKAGEREGKKYGQVRHYSTLVFAAAAPRERGGAEEQEPAAAGAVKADAAATKLLADARAARAIWADFPGFSADLEVNHNGTVTRGTVVVDAGGKVKLDLADAAAKSWAQRELNSLVAHRMGPPTEKETPCAFADKVVDHPLGRTIRVLNDELHSSYRIRDRQIIEVNRAMPGFRFTITVLENHLNPEKKYLPTAYVVNSWDSASGALRNSVAHHNTWVRIGNFDLPNTLTVVTARGTQTQGSTAGKGDAAPAGGLDSWGVRFTNHKLSR